MGLSKYEAQREANIARNRALLASLDVHHAVIPSTKGLEVQPASKKRKSLPADTGKSSHKKLKESPSIGNADNLRRSSRHIDKDKVDYAANDFQKARASPINRVNSSRSYDGGDHATSEDPGNQLGRRIHNPKTFGHIPGIPVGTWWEKRAHCSTDAVHAPFVAGISGDTKKGAYSVAMSGGYDDDVDLGYAFTFTGSGGRDLKGTANKPKNVRESLQLRTAPQSSDQTFENSFNKSLLVSSQTGKPVRVIRGYKVPSPYAPIEGYDGLYKVEKAWCEKGLNGGGFLVCKFAFTRLPGQPELPMRTVETGDTTPGQE